MTSQMKQFIIDAEAAGYSVKVSEFFAELLSPSMKWRVYFGDRSAHRIDCDLAVVTEVRGYKNLREAMKIS